MFKSSANIIFLILIFEIGIFTKITVAGVTVLINSENLKLSLDSSDEILISKAPNFQENPSVSWGGENFLVVWQDARIGGASAFHTFGTQVDSDGNVLDPSGILISNKIHFQENPSVAWGNSQFLIVWQDYDRYCHFFPCPNIYGTRMNSSGKTLDFFNIPISKQRNFQGNPSVAWDNKVFLVVWEDYRSGEADIFGARVSPNGSVLDPEGILISTAPDDQYFPNVTSDGSGFLVVWSDLRSGESDIYGARVSSDGIVLDSEGIPISIAKNFQTHPNLSWNGSQFLIVWHDLRSCGDYPCSDIYGTRVIPDGSVLDPEGIPISTVTENQIYPSVAWGNDYFFVVWEDYRSSFSESCPHNLCSDIYGVQVDSDGIVANSNGTLISEPISIPTDSQWDPSIASDGEKFLVVWEDADPNSFLDIYGVILE